MKFEDKRIHHAEPIQLGLPGKVKGENTKQFNPTRSPIRSAKTPADRDGSVSMYLRTFWLLKIRVEYSFRYLGILCQLG